MVVRHDGKLTAFVEDSFFGDPLLYFDEGRSYKTASETVMNRCGRSPDIIQNAAVRDHYHLCWCQLMYSAYARRRSGVTKRGDLSSCSCWEFSRHRELLGLRELLSLFVLAVCSSVWTDSQSSDAEPPVTMVDSIEWSK